jgi:hypothetical protein
MNDKKPMQTVRAAERTVSDDKKNDKKMMQIVGAVQRTVGDDKKTWWTKIGVAFQNKDGSWNLRFDYLPARLAETTIQLRDLDAPPTE